MRLIRGKGEQEAPTVSSPDLRIVHAEEEQALTKPPQTSVELGDLLIQLIKQCGSEMASSGAGAKGLTLGAKLSCGLYVPGATAQCLKFVIREIIANAYRHSRPSGAPVEVTLSSAQAANGDILIEIGDDGVGLPEGFAEWRDAGHGMVSIRARLQKIGAAVNVTSDDLGLRFQIVLYASAYTPRRLTPARDTFVWL